MEGPLQYPLEKTGRTNTPNWTFKTWFEAASITYSDWRFRAVSTETPKCNKLSTL